MYNHSSDTVSSSKPHVPSKELRRRQVSPRSMLLPVINEVPFFRPYCLVGFCCAAWSCIATDEEIEHLSIDIASNSSGLLPSNLIDIIVDSLESKCYSIMELIQGLNKSCDRRGFDIANSKGVDEIQKQNVPILEDKVKFEIGSQICAKFQSGEIDLSTPPESIDDLFSRKIKRYEAHYWQLPCFSQYRILGLYVISHEHIVPSIVSNPRGEAWIRVVETNRIGGVQLIRIEPGPLFFGLLVHAPVGPRHEKSVKVGLESYIGWEGLVVCLSNPQLAFGVKLGSGATSLHEIRTKYIPVKALNPWSSWALA
ncbi:hypothetical protein FXO37_01470 [Capsicum annuum]|nr:hypothetical protein FXO37_01470 [Capsicum annuum]